MIRNSLQRLCTASEMQAMDHHAIETLGVPGMVLMENAARSVTDWVEQTYLCDHPEYRIVVCCGKGNNGGDGFAIARLLQNRGYRVQVVEAGLCKTEDAQLNQTLWKHFGASTSYETEAATQLIQKADLLIDAIFGTGLERPIEGKYAEWIATMNQNDRADKIAVDIPSGIHADHGQIMGVAVECQSTVTFQVGKQGCYQYPGARYAGEVQVPDISIPPQWPEDATPTYLVTAPYIQTIFPHRSVDGHKGTFGHLLAICGSAGMAGAVVLASQAALKSGCGLVSAFVPLCLRDAFVGTCPELMTLSSSVGPDSYFSKAQVRFVKSALTNRDAVILGCGIGRHPETIEFLQELIPQIEQPLLIDADGLNNINRDTLQQRQAPTIITPHPKEFSRLCGWSVAEIQNKRIDAARTFAQEWQVIVVLKGAFSVVAEPGGQVFINPTGNDGMATGGSGDVLSGIIGSLLARGCDPLDATLLGVYLHGLSGDCTIRALSPSYLTASNLIHGLNGAFSTFE